MNPVCDRQSCGGAFHAVGHDFTDMRRLLRRVHKNQGSRRNCGCHGAGGYRIQFESVELWNQNDKSEERKNACARKAQIPQCTGYTPLVPHHH